MTGDSTSANGFWDRFFGPGNQITKEMIDGGRLTADGQEYLLARRQDLEQWPQLPQILPRKRGDTPGRDEIHWYAMAPGIAAFRQLGAELQSVLGPTYTHFTGRPATLDPDDPVDVAVAHRYGAHVYLLQMPRVFMPRVVQALKTQYGLWAAKPRRTHREVRPTGRILRDFELAVASRDRTAGEGLLVELEEASALDAHNYQFLRIRLLSELGETDEIANLIDLVAITQMRRPWPVTQAIMKAVYLTTPGLTGAQTVDEQCAIFTDELRQRFGPLFTSKRHVTDPYAARLTAFAAATQTPPDVTRLEHLAAQEWDEETAVLLTSFLQLARDAQGYAKPDRETDPTALLEQGRYLEALDLAESLPLGPRTTSLLLRCAYEIDTQDAAKKAVDSFDSLPPASQDSLTAQRWVRGYLQALRPRSRSLPSDWLDWYRSLEHDASTATLDVLDTALLDWDPIEQCGTAIACRAIAGEMLKTRSAEATIRVADSVPRMLDFVFEVDAETSQSILNAAFDTLALESRLGDVDLGAMSAILDRLLSAGLSESDYADRLEIIQDVWASVESPARVDWITGVCASLLFHACPNSDKRLALFVQVVESLRRRRDDLQEDQDDFIRFLAETITAASPDEWWPVKDVADEPSTHWSDRLDGKVIGLHSLLEGATRAASDYITSKCPGAHVLVNHDKVATKSLDAMAEGSDIMVVTWGATKHAVTDRIRHRRPKNLPLLWASGGGASSIIRAIREQTHEEG